MTIMAIDVLLHWIQANRFKLVVRQNHGRPQERQSKGESRGAIEAIVPPKTYELTLLAMMCAILKTSFAIQGHFVIHCFVTDVLW